MVQRIDRDLERFQARSSGGSSRKTSASTCRPGELIGKKGKNVFRSPSARSKSPPSGTRRASTAESARARANPDSPSEPAKAKKARRGGRRARAPHARGGCHARRTGRDNGGGTRTAQHQAQVQAQHRSRRGALFDYRPDRPGIPPALQAHVQEALKRQIASGAYDSKRPVIIPSQGRPPLPSPQDDPLPETNAVIIYVMDVSGSMGDEQKEIVRNESFWINTWLQSQYKGLETRYIVHDAEAHEVDEQTFFHTRESGGTRISSAYTLVHRPDRRALSARRVERVRVPLLRRRQLGRRRHADLSEDARRAPPARDKPVLLRAGGEPVRQRRVHQRPACGVRRSR